MKPPFYLPPCRQRGCLFSRVVVGADPYRHKDKNLLAMITYPQHRRGGVSLHAHIVYHSEAYNIKASISEGGGPCLHGGRSFANKNLMCLFVIITPSVAFRRQLPQGGAFK